MKEKKYVRILSIAGSDSSGGAGIQADIKTIAALGCYGMTAITALTAQNTLGVWAIHETPTSMLEAQINAVITDVGVDAIKIGMLPCEQAVDVVARVLNAHPSPRVVLDPVMVSSSGHFLMDTKASIKLIEKLAPSIGLLTPNLDEAAVLLNRPVELIKSQLDTTVRDLYAQSACPVLLKGGHLEGNEVIDVFWDGHPNGQLQRWTSPRIRSTNTHGTGCTLSSAIACFWGMGHRLDQAIDLARQYVLQAIGAGENIHTGAGHGPLNHGFAPLPMRLV